MLRTLKLLALTCDVIAKHGWVSRRSAEKDATLVPTADRVILSYARARPSKQGYTLARALVNEITTSWTTRADGWTRRAYLDTCKVRLPLREAPFACTIPHGFAEEMAKEVAA